MADGDHTVTMKACKCCGETMPETVEFFYRHKMGKNGLHPRCRSCVRASNAARRATDDAKAKQKAWRDANKEKTSAYGKAYRAAGYKSTAAVAEWRRINLHEARAKDAARARERRACDPGFRLLGRMRARLWSMMRGRESATAISLLGYTVDDLKAHLERQFTKGMSWGNIGDWEVDHIVPVSSFNITSADDEDFKACWALSNLRPVWRSVNRSKGAKAEFLI